MGLLNLLGIGRRRQESLSMNPADDFWYQPAVPTNSSGISVNESVALTYSACWAATRLLAGTGGMLPFNLYRYLPNGGSEIDYSLPLQRVLHDETNDEMSSMAFRNMAINHQVNRGNCFAEIRRDGAGRVIALSPIHARKIPTNTNIKRVGGRLVYLVNNDDGTKTAIRQENMFHVPSIITDDGIVGRGVIENARLTIGFGIAAEQHGASYFGNGARPGLIIKGAKFRKAEDAETFRDAWWRTHGSPSQHGKPAILPPDADVTTLPFNASDSQFLESRQNTIEEIGRWYGVPSHLLNDLRRATFSNIENLGIEFVKYSLMPWLKLWEQEVWRKLLTKEQQRTHYAKFKVDALERGDKASRTAASVQEIFNGLLTINQWAEREDMNPIGPLGDIHWTQQAMVPLEIAAKGPQPTKPDESPAKEEQPTDDGLSAKLESMQQTNRQLASAMLHDVMGRLLRIEVKAVHDISQKPNRFDQRLREFYDRHTQTMTRSLTEPVSVVLAASGDEREPAAVVYTLTQAHVSESIKRLEALTDCTADELPGKVEACVATWHEERVGVSL